MIVNMIMGMTAGLNRPKQLQIPEKAGVIFYDPLYRRS